jgi:hypothetical protein
MTCIVSKIYSDVAGEITFEVTSKIDFVQYNNFSSLRYTRVVHAVSALQIQH